MSDMKDNGLMAEHDSSDTSDSEEMIDADADQEESAQSGDDESPNENGESPMEEVSTEHPLEPTIDGNADENEQEKSKSDGGDEGSPENHLEDAEPNEGVSEIKFEDTNEEELDNEEKSEGMPHSPEENGAKVEASSKQELAVEEYPVNPEASNQSFLVETHMVEGDESGTEEQQAAFMRELENFFKERSLEFKAPKFYGEGLNCLKLWRAVTKLGGYDQVTSCKLWRQVGESFKPPKTCTTVSWSFRCFYEKALLEYERHKMRGGELPVPVASITEPMSAERQSDKQASGSGRARRDAAARAMQGWHSQRLLGNGEVGDPIIKDKSAVSLPKRDKHLKSVGLLKRKKPTTLDRAVKAARTITKTAKPQMETVVADIGPAADWVKVNVRKTKDCFEVYALVPGLLREEVRVQSDPAGRLVISGDPEQPDNPWGVTPFKKVISLPSRIDPHQTSAVVTLHGQLFVRVPFEQSDL